MKTKTKSSMALALAIIALLAIAASIVFGIGWQKCWFGHKYNDEDVCERCGAERPVEEPEEEPEETEAPLAVTEKNELLYASSGPIGLSNFTFLRAAQALSEGESDGVVISATVEPADSVNKKLDWEVSFENPTSAWANGKDANDYLELEISDDTQRVKVICNDAFGERIVITATAVANAEASASCTVDYMKRLKENFHFHSNYTEVNTLTVNGDTMFIIDDDQYETGTVKGGRVSLSATFSASSPLTAQLNREAQKANSSLGAATYTQGSHTKVQSDMQAINFTLDDLWAAGLNGGGDASVFVNAKNLMQNYIATLTPQDTMYSLSVTLTVCQELAGASQTVTSYAEGFTLDASAVETIRLVTGITLNTSTVTF